MSDEFVTSPKGLAPGEIRLVRKLTGTSPDQLEPDDQVRVMAFAALLRKHRDPLTNELDTDPAVLWEQAEWVELRPDEERTSPLDTGN